MNGRIPDKETYLREVLDVLIAARPDSRTVNIICDGHSVPAGYMRTPVVDPFAAYPHQLLAGLKERFAYAVVNVIVTAVGGSNSEAGSERFAGHVLCHRPDVVTLDYALNDRALGLARADRAWRRMIEMALEREAKVVLLTPTHDVLTLRTGEARWTEERRLHAEQVRRLAAEYGVGLADSDRAFERYLAAGGEVSDLLSHVNHPNRLGHELVARELLRWFPAQ